MLTPRQSTSLGSPPVPTGAPPALAVLPSPPWCRVPSQCSRSCGEGTKVRDVHCVDTREQRLLRPFHCQAGLGQPPAQLPCHSLPCLPWYTSSWREVRLPWGTPPTTPATDP